MATVVKTFNWTSNADSFTFTANGDATGTWSSTGGDADAGCLITELSGRNKADIGAWTRSLTFEDMGVPSGATVTGITSASIKSQVTTYGSVDACTLGNVTLDDGTTTVVLAASRSATSTDATFQTQSGTDNSSLNWASSQSVTITLNHNLDNANSPGKQIEYYWDTLTFTITYTTGSLSGSLDKTLADMTLSADATLSPVLYVSENGVYEDGTESGSTFLGSTLDGLEIPWDTPFQFRLVVQNTGGNYDATFKLRAKLNDGIFGVIGGVADYADATNLTDGQATTQRLGTGTFDTGRVYESINDAATVTINANSETELLFSLTIDSTTIVQHLDTVTFLLQEGDGTGISRFGASTITVVDPDIANVTLDATLADMTLDASGSVDVAASTDVTLDTMTLAADAVVDVAASTDVTLEDMLLSADGSIVSIATGELDYLLDELTLDSAATAIAGCSLDATLADMTASSDADVVIGCSLSQTLSDMTAESAAVVDLSGNLSQTLSDMALASDAVVDIAASLDATLGAMTLSSEVQVQTGYVAWLDKTLAEMTLASAVDTPAAGELDYLLGDMLLDGAGEVVFDEITGDLNQSLGTMVLSASVDTPATGATDYTFDTMTGESASSVVIGPSLDATFGDMGLAADASVDIAAATDATLGDMVLASDTAATATGATDATLGTMTLVADATVIDGAALILEATLADMVLSADGSITGAVPSENAKYVGKLVNSGTLMNR